MSYIDTMDRDLLDNTQGLIAHQVNCQGVMGSGVAKAVKERYPEVFDAYKAACKAAESPGALLGTAQFVTVSDALTVINVFAQDFYGSGGAVYTNYDATSRAFVDIVNFYARCQEYPGDLYIPFKMGCDRGGGDWEAYKAIIDTAIRSFPRDLTVSGVKPVVVACKLPG